MLLINNMSKITFVYLLEFFTEKNLHGDRLSLTYITLLQVRFGLEVVVVLGAIIYLGLAMKEIYHQGFNIFFTTLVNEYL